MLCSSVQGASGLHGLDLPSSDVLQQGVSVKATNICHPCPASLGAIPHSKLYRGIEP